MNNSNNTTDSTTAFTSFAKKSVGLTLPPPLLFNGQFQNIKLKGDSTAGYCFNPFDGIGYAIKGGKTIPFKPSMPIVIEVQADIKEVTTPIPCAIEQQGLSEEEKSLTPDLSSSITALDSSTDDNAMPTNPNDSTMPTDEPTDYHDQYADLPTEKPTSINLSNPKEAEAFVMVIIEKLTNCTNELEAIQVIMEAMTEYKATGFNKVIADYLANQVAANVNGLKGKKTVIKAGIVSGVKAVQIAKKIKHTVADKNCPTRLMLDPNLFPDTAQREDGLLIKSTENNLKRLLNGYGIAATYDEITRVMELIVPDRKSTLDHDLHNENNIQFLRSLAALNEINKDIVEFLPSILIQNTINPVKDFIFSKKWDGVSRLNEFYNSLVILPEDRVLTNKIIRTWLIQSIAALDRGVVGCAKNYNAIAKYELVLTFQGIQGASKTTWFSNLLPRTLNGEKFSSRYIITGGMLQLDNKDSIKQAISAWIVELGELDATFRKSDIAALKAFLSKVSDIFRLPYARIECAFARATSYCASVNDEQFLNDISGNRRFAVIKLSNTESGRVDMQQLWAEVWELYASGEQWWLDKETENAMQLRNEQHQSLNPIEDAILTKYDWGSPSTMWTNRMTMTEIYQSCFDKKPNRSDLNAIKPFLQKRGAKVSTFNGCVVGFIPPLKNSDY